VTGSAVLAAAVTAGDGGYARVHNHDWEWAFFLGLVVALIVADLLILHREPREMKLREAAVESVVWIAIGLSFGLFVIWRHGGQAGGEYYSGYLIEESLSVDNVFVWAVIFTYFAVPRQFQFRTLFWGIFGALVLRSVFIFTGVELVKRFDAVLYGFGAFLLYTAYKISRHDETEVHPEKNIGLRIVKRIIPSQDDYDGQKLFSRVSGARLATPLFAVLIMVETTDLLFAVDSIPAVLAVSRSPFIVFSSNAFAILGLRALYFCLAGMAGRFRYLNVGLGFVLAFVGVKMLLNKVWHPPTWLGLSAIVLFLATSVAASIWAERRDQARSVGS
jgi:tellurite resistance protein TerC